MLQRNSNSNDEAALVEEERVRRTMIVDCAAVDDRIVMERTDRSNITDQ